MKAILSLAAALMLTSPALAETKTYDIKGMHCESCHHKIAAKVCQMPGIEKCDVQIDSMTLTGAKLDDEAISKAVESAGKTYKVIKITVDK